MLTDKTSPYKKFDSKYDGSAHYGSLGFGIRTKYVFFDMAYVMKYSKDSFRLYQNDDVISTRGLSHRVVATIGCKF